MNTVALEGFDWHRVVRVNDPELPVTIDQVRDHLRVDGNNENDLHLLYLQSAVAWIEDEAGISIASQQWDYYLDKFYPRIPIGLGPVISVDEISYTLSGTPGNVVASTVYQVDVQRGLIRLAEGQAWPSPDDNTYNAVKIRFSAGWATPPADLKAAVLQLVAHQDQNRTPVVTGTIATELPMGVQTIIERYRRGRFV